jgi:hypothetical protein
VVSICASGVSAQQKTAATGQNTWQEVKLDTWGVNFSIPKNLKAVPQTEDEKPDFSEKDFSESRNFKRSVPKTQSLKMSVDLRNFDGETVKTESNGKEYILTPADLLRLDASADSRAAEEADSSILEANDHEIDGVNGSLVVMNATRAAGKSVKPTNDIVVIWGSYRLFKGNVQKVMVTIEGKRTQLETMKKIIDSLKFAS